MSTRIPSICTSAATDSRQLNHTMDQIEVNKLHKIDIKSTLAPHYFSKKPSQIPRKSRMPHTHERSTSSGLNQILDLLETMIDPTEKQQQTVTLRQSCSLFSECGRMIKTQSKTVRLNIMPHAPPSSPVSGNNAKPMIRLKSGSGSGYPLSRLLNNVGLRKGIFSTSDMAEPNLLPSKFNNLKHSKITIQSDETVTDLTKKSKLMRPLTAKISLSRTEKKVSSLEFYFSFQ